MELNEDKIVGYLDNFLNNEYVQLDKNLKMILKDYKRKSKRLNTIVKQSDKQQAQLLKLNEELDEYKNHLEQKVEEEIALRKEKEKMLFQQSKLAAMGEMMDAVAHQWKQPINIINMQVDMMGYDFEDKLIDQEYVDKFQSKISNQVKHMTSTLKEFRSFFRPNKEVEEFDIKAMIDSVLLLVKDEFMKNQITIEVDEQQNFSLSGIENEFKHLVLNIINNSKDAFNDNNIKNRIIKIDILSDENTKSIEIQDNAGGIPTNIINDIFKANVTSKAEGKGTGIGLYMSSQIATKHNGTLDVANCEDGAKFIFQIG
ncbi:MAG: HAMP domain-containing sensor histidine kinase [Campylobacterota bacterium]|nr:HAMP domain-containing sensor histidine kinase [Campylobacterota bacterium]